MHLELIRWWNAEVWHPNVRTQGQIQRITLFEKVVGNQSMKLMTIYPKCLQFKKLLKSHKPRTWIFISNKWTEIKPKRRRYFCNRFMRFFNFMSGKIFLCRRAGKNQKNFKIFCDTRSKNLTNIENKIFMWHVRKLHHQNYSKKPTLTSYVLLLLQ